MGVAVVGSPLLARALSPELFMSGQGAWARGGLALMALGFIKAKGALKVAIQVTRRVRSGCGV